MFAIHIRNTSTLHLLCLDSLVGDKCLINKVDTYRLEVRCHSSLILLETLPFLPYFVLWCLLSRVLQVLYIY